jgi:chemotaxis methyl-accepting protein methylase
LNDHQFQQILNHFNLSWKGYRKVRKGVKKRLNRHMQSLGCRTVEAYLKVIEAHEQIRRECQRRLTVSISRFFRDTALWQALQNEVLPQLAAIEGTAPLAFWSAGCACGEEAYSISLLWHRLKSGGQALPKLNIIATDVNPDCLFKAQTGIYNQSSLKHVPHKDRQTYFSALPRGRRFRIKPKLAEPIQWQTHTLLAPPPRSRFDLVFLRNNLLTYYQNPEKSESFHRIADTIKPHGYLIIGAHEHLPANAAHLFHQLPASPHIFCKAPPT